MLLSIVSQYNGGGQKLRRDYKTKTKQNKGKQNERTTKCYFPLLFIIIAPFIFSNC